MRILKKQFAWYAAATIVLFLAAIAESAAAQYQPLTGIPGIVDDQPSLASYVSALFMLSISLGALFAVIKIAIAGVTYMMSEVVTSKQEAIRDINGALLGLAILLATFVVLNTINPNLVNLTFLTPDTATNSTPTSESDNEPGVFTYQCTTPDCNVQTTGCINSGGTPQPTTINGNPYIECEIPDDNTQGGLQEPSTEFEPITCEGNRQFQCNPDSGCRCVNTTKLVCTTDGVEGDCAAQVTGCESSGGNPQQISINGNPYIQCLIEF
jgi:hypothetical protein